MSELPEAVRIRRIVNENPYVKTFFLDKKIEAEPGQFVMAWIPGTDEKPFSLSYAGSRAGITVEKKGRFTEQLFGLGPGDMIGIRGPYGKGFPVGKGGCIVAGGCGIAPLAVLTERMENPFLIMGARSSERIIFSKRFRDAHIVTDDGSEGRKGFTTEALADALGEEDIGTVYTCGPEIMMKKVFDLCESRKVKCYVSLERFMKCGFGVCGQCEINGYRVCKDGPVFSSEQLRRMEDFGKRARLKSGKNVPLSEYGEWRCK